MKSATTAPEKRRKLGRWLLAMFVLALVMGPGPGIYLINPDPGDAEARRFFLGAPIVYVWAAFWFIIQASAVALSYQFLWKTTPGSTTTPEA